MAVDTIPNLIARATVVRNETITNANTAIRVGELFIDVVDTLNFLKINIGGITQATELTIGGLKLANQAVSQTSGEALEANRNHTDAVTARSFRWAFETMLGKEWTWLDRQVFDTAVRLAYANANEYLKLDANKDIVGVSAIDYNDLDNLPNLSLKADLVGGLVPASQLPSYVDDVLEFANLASFPLVGETGKIYVALDTNKTYRWSGSIYVEVSSLDEALQADVENILTTIANTYVSPRRFWQGIQHTVTLAWTWSLKQTFSSGINVATASTPAVNGDFVFNTTAGAYQGRVGGVTQTFLTSLNGKLGRVLFVSKDGNDSTAQIGSVNFSYLTIQGAINASTSGDTIVILNGTYTESLNFLNKSLSLELHDAIIVGNHTGMSATRFAIDMLGRSEIRGNSGASICLYVTATNFTMRGGMLTHNFNSIGLYLENNSSCLIDNVVIKGTTTTNLVYASSTTGISQKISNCIIVNNGAGTTLNGAGTGYKEINHSWIINIGSGVACKDSNNGGRTIYNTTYIRSANNYAFQQDASANYFVVFNQCDIIANNNTAIFCTTNTAYNIVINQGFVYGTNCVDRGTGSPASGNPINKIEANETRFFATSGEIFINVPTSINSRVDAINTKTNKAFTVAQTTDPNFVPFNNYVNINMLASTNLTLSF